MRLLEEYSVGQTLGEGAFGVVSKCTKRSTGEEFAVKMVDKVETPVDAIRREADMLQSMDHPNVVKVHGVYYEKCFVCIVMDKYSGGDLVEGLQRHLKEKGQIDCYTVVHVARQMGSSIQYLHNRSVVHRDVKGDNYLMDRNDMTDMKCKVVLTDFGTACRYKPGERMSSGVGTKIFWSPEFYDRSYGAKVDIWAMGIINYGLVSGRFPFRDENDVRGKEVKIPKRVHAQCEEFIKQMLDKAEKTRPDANSVMAHAWLATKEGRGTDAIAVASNEDATPAEGMKEEGVGEHVKERRQELIGRLNKEDQIRRNPDPAGNQRPVSKHYQQKSFVLADKQVQGLKVSYEWWEASRVKASKILDLDNGCRSHYPGDNVVEESYLRIFSSMLLDHNIDPERFGRGKAKKLEQLAQEVRSGSARLMLDAKSHKTLVRLVDIVLVRIRCNGQVRKQLVEVEERYPDGRRRATFRLPGTKKEPYENTRQVAERIVTDMLKMPPGSVQFDLVHLERHEEETESPSYPGVCTVYRKELVEGVVILNNGQALADVGLPEGTPWNACDASQNTKFFQWMVDKEAESKGVKLRADATEAVSTLVRPPIGLNEDALRTHLNALEIDVSKFGANGCKSIKEFSQELLRGESTLQQEPTTKKLQRIVDVVLLVVMRPGAGEILIQTEQVDARGHRTRLDRLPGAKCRPDENQFLSARRILRRQLDINENMVKLDKEVGILEEERHSPAYPGLRTVYRKRIIKAELLP